MSHENVIPENSPESILRTKGYSLWVVPEGNELQQLNTLIEKLAKKLNAPSFTPHMTILGGIDLKEENILAKMEKLAATQKPFDIELNGIDYEEVWNRTLFIRGKDPSILDNLINNSEAVFESGNRPPFPHMSIVYGAFSKKAKEETIKEINRNYPTKFKTSSIQLFNMDGIVNEWKKIAEISLIK